MIPVLQKPSVSADSPLILATGAEEQTATIAKVKTMACSDIGLLNQRRFFAPRLLLRYEGG